MTGAIKALIFDKDGTLFDFEATWCAWSRGLLLDLAEGDAAHAARMGAAVGYVFDPAGGPGRFERTSPVIAGTADGVARLLLPHLPGMDAAGLIARMNARASAAPQAEVVPLGPLLARLRGRGLRLGVATNDSEAPARAHLRAVGAETAFDFIAGADSGYGGKPEAGQLLAFADRFDLDPAQVAMVGDSLHDLAAAQAAGMRGVGVLSGFATAGDLAPHAHAVLPHIGALEVWLDAGAPAGVAP
ncbi:HAD family hydrolase [Phaeovulum vinaykumarii]|uniref:phosphoglycolate phosphatase n=1 Tax=Phaeovulum vinaykumarii TaxID=407234 RepID=A0A1N7KW29_9RHOB|nr:HAD-IA family hydrolase [Phaeovulum vinaykumarii]SIS65842.1 phosphoglycolate phosphatase [Phaeovulum vinaykumarii]SOC01172.1 phosphoglycolate phosphatase [Phaeovulum vinaykumarii]